MGTRGRVDTSPAAQGCPRGLKLRVQYESHTLAECVKAGSKYALIVGDQVYGLSDQKAPEKFAAQKVTVTGTLDGKTIQVKSITAAK